LKSLGVEAAVVSRRGVAGLLSATLLACAVASQAQDGDSSESLRALRQGPLIVWFVVAPNRPPKTALAAIFALHDVRPSTYVEETPGNFGQSSSTYGQSSSSYGVDASSATISAPHSGPGEDAPAAHNGIGYKQQEAGSFGQTAGNYGTTSGTYGIESGNLGQTEGSFGTAASNHGVDLAGLGESTSAMSEAGKRKAAPVPSAVVQRFMDRLRRAFPNLEVTFTEVDPDKLAEKLRTAQGAAAYPDVLLGALPSSWWNQMQGAYGLAMLRPASFYQDGVTEDEPQLEQVAILSHAVHMAAARAFALWMSEPGKDCPGCVQVALTSQERAAAAVATSAMKRLLNGESMGDEADPAMAGNLSEGVRRMLTTTGDAVAGDASFRVEVEHVSTNGGLAAVALRVVASSKNVFGVAHPLVVLRTAKNEQWRVLQMSLNLPQFEQTNVRERLMETAPTSAAERRGGVKGVSLATPHDGAQCVPQPELVWDNNGGAGLQVVEWQRGRGGSWSDARLYLVEDRSPRLQTHVIAQFAGEAGRYRWRVWSVGAEGDMKISPWRTFSAVE
ncbi:MAG TPA: hypothetical protein VIJ65_00070, partial [Acidobacteriaceae bacterium]